MNFELVGPLLLALIIYRMLRPGIDMAASALWSSGPTTTHDNVGPGNHSSSRGKYMEKLETTKTLTEIVEAGMARTDFGAMTMEEQTISGTYHAEIGVLV